MPGGDGTGPTGMGPMTGRAAGLCAGYPVPGFANPIAGFGRGFGLGFGRGWGRGLGWGRGFGRGRGFGGGYPYGAYPYSGMGMPYGSPTGYPYAPNPGYPYG
ncbi:DUF5320 family protein, partial [bacterium]|nr:DUF5320 family protein [bacterium]